MVCRADFREKRISLCCESLFQFLRTIAVATGPWFAAVFVPAGATGMRILHAEQFKIFFPIRTLFRKRRIAEASFHPDRSSGFVQPRFAHVV